MFIEVLFMLIGQFIASLSIFMIRASELPSGYLAAYRLFLAVLILLPLCLRDLKGMRHTGTIMLPLRRALIPGMFLGMHFLFWNKAIHMTLAANASLLVNMVLLFMPLVIFILTGERPLWQELCATLIAFAGVIILTIGNLSLGGENTVGDVYAFISMILLAVYLAFARRNKSLPFWYYTVAVYFFGGIIVFLVSFLSGMPLWTSRGIVEILPVFGLALGPTLLGHNLINRSMRRMSSQLVSVGNLSQIVWVGLIAWMIYDEVPQPMFYPAIALIGLGMGIVILTHYKIQIRSENETRLS